MEPKYKVDILERIKELALDTTVEESGYFIYSWDRGYEKLDHKQKEEYGSSHYASSYHPQGFCDNGHSEDKDDDGTGICMYCGCTLM